MPIQDREIGVARVKDDKEVAKHGWCRSPSRVNSGSVVADKELGEISSESSCEDVGNIFDSLSNGCNKVLKRHYIRKRKNSYSPNTKGDFPLLVDKCKLG